MVKSRNSSRRSSEPPRRRSGYDSTEAPGKEPTSGAGPAREALAADRSGSRPITAHRRGRRAQHLRIGPGRSRAAVLLGAAGD